MEALETLAVALGFATLAGLNLYLTVFVTGLAINQQLIDVSAKYPELAILGEPAIVIAAGIFTLCEFFSDKIPWVDSFWDSVHTLIRPIGGGLLALQALGPMDPAFEVIVGMLAGGAAFMTHGLKSGTRLAVNTSPEPVTNVTMSVTEDMAVVGGLALMSVNPFVFAGVCLVLIVLSIYLAPKLIRRSRGYAWLNWHKISSLFQPKRSVTIMNQPITADDEIALNRFIEDGNADVRWSMPVLVGGRRRFGNLTSYTFGKIFAINSDPSAIHFVGRKNFKLYHQKIDLEKYDVIYEPRFLSDDLVLENQAEGRRACFKLPAGSEDLVKRVCEALVELQIETGKEKGTLPQSQPVASVAVLE